jgi:cytoskeletal protein RodZ
MKGLTLDELAYTSRIDKKFLVALERGDWDLLPGPIYVRSYLRTYSIIVGLDPQYMMRLASSILSAQRSTKKTKQTLPSRSRTRGKSVQAGVVAQQKRTEQEAAFTRSTTESTRTMRLQQETSSRRRQSGAYTKTNRSDHQSQPVGEDKQLSRSNRSRVGENQSRKKESTTKTEKKKKLTFGALYTRVLIIISILLVIAGAYVIWLRASTDEVKTNHSFESDGWKSVLISSALTSSSRFLYGDCFDT